MMLNIDPKVWDFGLDQLVATWNLLPRKNKETKQILPP